MINGKQIITRCFTILILCGIVLVGGYGLYMSFSNFDKSVPVYLRNDALYDESGNMVADLSIDNNRTSKNAQVSPSLKDVLIEGLGGEKKGFEDYSIFGCSKEEVQKLYIQSVIESMASGKTVEVSRWVTSGDWSNDDEEMTITLP